MEKKKDKIGLALSGGGYRAATYHIGTFRALEKMGVLDKVNVISTNSGGSIAGACYSLNHTDFDKFENILINGVQKSVIGRLIRTPRFFIPVLIMLGIIVFSIGLFFTSYAWLNILIGPAFIIAFLYAQYEILPISRIIEKIYDDIFYQKATLGDLSGKFETVINSTNLDTGRIFHFSKDKMGDTKYTGKKAFESENQPSFPVSKAVMASSCVPFAFTPVKIQKKYFRKPEFYSQIKPRLVDGGVYDNQGIHKLTHLQSGTFCKNVIVSDAGTQLPFENNYRNMFTLLVRTSSVFMARIKNLQKMNSVHSIPQAADSIVAYQSLGDNLAESLNDFIERLQFGHLSNEVIAGHNISEQLITDKDWAAIKQQVSDKLDVPNLVEQGCSAEELKIARTVSTNLTPLKDAQTKALIKHAAAITEIQVKLYLPHIL
ncbi:MAG: NTE family protein [Crocinitomix sp.]|jgi:NTE family protein